MTARDAAIAAGCRAWHGDAWDRMGNIGKARWRDLVAAVVDAVEPIIRADERRIQHDGRECVCARTEADTEANLRERIAQEIEATGHAISCVTRYNGPLAPDVYECDCGLERHLRIARGGESDG